MACIAQIGQCFGLLGATLDVRPSDIPGKTQARDNNEQGAAAFIAAAECTDNEDLKSQLPAAESRRELPDGGAWLHCTVPY
ncbi:hypothetical protein BDD12DRAFT_894728 [Trichophaea hybrida]|nr:hypothetical protein BDD12DRAFT_894728 [Trichophaea hybrida]